MSCKGDDIRGQLGTPVRRNKSIVAVIVAINGINLVGMVLDGVFIALKVR